MDSRSRTRGTASAVWFLLVPGFAIAMDADAQVIRCVDAAGNITYQDVPCEPGQSGRNVTLPAAEASENAAWEAAARDARVIKGMPKRWVMRARGKPLEIRPGTAKEEATEVWRYAGRDGPVLIGFAGPDVAWIREDSAPRKSEPPTATAPAAPPPAAPVAPPPATAAASPPAAPSASPPAGPAASPPVAQSIRGPQNRRFVIAGRYCEHVLAEIGSPDRQEPVAASGDAAAGVRYFYEPQAGDPLMRTVFSCIGGKVADVERTVVK